MKKCSDCNVEMMENIRIEGSQRFEVGPSSTSNIIVLLPSNSIFSRRAILKARVCPNCGKVELYIVPNKK